MLTGVLGQRDDLAQKLCEVREIIAEKAGLKDNSLAGMRCSQLTTKEFRLACDAESRSSLGVLKSVVKLAQVALLHPLVPPYLESKAFQSDGQSRQRLVSSTSLGNDGKGRRRAVGIP